MSILMNVMGCIKADKSMLKICACLGTIKSHVRLHERGLAIAVLYAIYFSNATVFVWY